MMTAKGNRKSNVAEILEAVRQMKAGDKARIYSPEQILAIGARQSSSLTQEEFARLLDVSVDAIRDWEHRRSPKGAARTLLRIAMTHPEVLVQING